MSSSFLHPSLHGSPQSAEAPAVIRAGRLPLLHHIAELWRFRELCWFLAWRSIAIKYKQTFVGVSWALIQPIITVIVFTFIFGHVAKLSANGVPYPLLTLAGVLPWLLFSEGISAASSSVVGAASMVSKIYFPRSILPISAVVASVMEFAIALLVLVAMMAWFGFGVTPRFAALPLLIGLVLALALGIGMWLSALNVRYRDVKYAVPFLLRVGMYISPVGFASLNVPESWRWAYNLNPLVGVIDGFRWALLGESSPVSVEACLSSVLVALVTLTTGFVFFVRTERSFADII